MIVADNKQRQEAYFSSELSRLQAEKVEQINALVKKCDDETERKVVDERFRIEALQREYEQNMENMLKQKDECMIELSEYDGKMESVTEEYDKRIEDAKKTHDKKIADVKDRLKRLKESLAMDIDLLSAQLENDIKACQKDYYNEEMRFDNEIRELQQQFKPAFDEIHELFMRIYRGGSPELEETKGVVCNTFYIFNNNEASRLEEQIHDSNGENGALMPVKIYEIRHDKDPIIFLYERIDSSKIASDFRAFMDAVNIGLYTINCRRIFELYITDPVSKGINFKDQEKAGRLHIIDDIKKLYNIISDSMEFVAEKGERVTIDDLNRRLIADGNDEDDINKFGKYRIVQFIVPEEESNQTTDFFSSEIWTRFETSKKHGFLPIFFIKRSEWESALDNEDEFKSKFIMKLNKVLGEDHNNIFVIDPKNIVISKYN